MLKVGNWYSSRIGNLTFGNDILYYTVSLSDNPNYIFVDAYILSDNMKVIHTLNNIEMDAVAFERDCALVPSPSPAWKILYVNKNLDNVNNLDTENEYNEE